MRVARDVQLHVYTHTLHGVHVHAFSSRNRNKDSGSADTLILQSLQLERYKSRKNKVNQI